MEAVKDFINSKDDFAIICHKNPDGDTLGSGLALYHSLKKMGKACWIYCNDKPVEMYNILDGVDEILPLDSLAQSNLIFCDCADMERTAFSKNLADYNVLSIDHHISNNNFGDVNLVRKSASATCVIMYDVITSLGIEIDSVIAKCLYVGICTDTNNFTNSNTDSETFFVASKLAIQNFNIGDIVKVLFRTKSLAKTKATGLYIDRLKFMLNGRLAISYISKEDIYSLNIDDTEGFVNIGADVKGVSVSAFLKEDDDGSYKVSMRSNYDVDVCKVCEAFGGGGHIKASGCRISKSLDEAIEAICSEVSKWMES